jgi:glucan phosphoethanolaminetransferase (alkaline phosphatase superfamily)
MNASRVGLKDNRVGFFAGLAGGFGFYISWMIVAMNWQTATNATSAIKDIIGFVLGLVVGALLYLGVFLLNKTREATISKRITRYTLLGIVTGLIIAFFFGMLFYNPTGLGPAPIFPLKPLFPLD